MNLLRWILKIYHLYFTEILSLKILIQSIQSNKMSTSLKEKVRVFYFTSIYIKNH